jgi:hypothetical protein
MTVFATKCPISDTNANELALGTGDREADSPRTADFTESPLQWE